MYQNFISRRFSNQSGIIILVNWPRAFAEFSNWLSRVLWGRILRGRHHGTRLWNSVDVKWLWRILQSSARYEHDMMPNMMKQFMTHFSSKLNQRCFAFIRPRTPLVYIYHVISRPVSGWMWTGRAAQIDAKTTFRFRNIVPEKWTLSGCVQHTDANSMYKNDNKVSQQQKVLYMNKMLEHVTHFQTSFSVGIQPLS